MENGRIIELLSDMLIEMREMKQEQQETNKRLDRLDSRIERLEEQQAKTNITLADVRLAVVQLADKIGLIVEHETRLARREAAVFK